MINSFPCPSVAEESIETRIQNCGATLTTTSEFFQIDGDPNFAVNQYEIWWTDQGADAPDAAWNDPLDPVTLGTMPGGLGPYSGLPNDGRIVWLRLRCLPEGGDPDNPSDWIDADICSVTSVTQVGCELSPSNIVVIPGQTSVSMQWNSSVPVTGQVCYGTDPNNLNFDSNASSQFLTSHSQNFPNGGDPALTPNTTYFYEIKGVSEDGRCLSGTGQFTTTGVVNAGIYYSRLCNQMLDACVHPPGGDPVVPPDNAGALPLSPVSAFPLLSPQPGDIPGMVKTRITGSPERKVFVTRDSFNMTEEKLRTRSRIYDYANNCSVLRNSLSLTNQSEWSRLRPNVIIGIRPGGSLNILAEWDVVSNAVTNIATFPGYSNLSMGNSKGSLSDDDRYVVLTGEKAGNAANVIFTYDMVAGQILGEIDQTPHYNWAGISPDGKYVLGMDNRNITNAAAQTMLYRYDRDLNPASFLRLTDYTSHWDMGYGTDGRIYVALISWPLLHAIDIETGYRLNGTNTSPSTQPLGNAHISGRGTYKRPGHFLVSNNDSQRRIGVFKIGRIAGNPQVGTHFAGRPVYETYGYYEHWGWTDNSNNNNGLASPEATPSRSFTKIIYKENFATDDDQYCVVLEYPQNCV